MTREYLCPTRIFFFPAAVAACRQTWSFFFSYFFLYSFLTFSFLLFPFALRASSRAYAGYWPYFSSRKTMTLRWPERSAAKVVRRRRMKAKNSAGVRVMSSASSS